eukprot:gene8293-biopygen22617
MIGSPSLCSLFRTWYCTAPVHRTRPPLRQTNAVALQEHPPTRPAPMDTTPTHSSGPGSASPATHRSARRYTAVSICPPSNSSAGMHPSDLALGRGSVADSDSQRHVQACKYAGLHICATNPPCSHCRGAPIAWGTCLNSPPYEGGLSQNRQLLQVPIESFFSVMAAGPGKYLKDNRIILCPWILFFNPAWCICWANSEGRQSFI